MSGIRSVFQQAEEKDTSEAYREMYETFSRMPYGRAYGLLADATHVLETKFILGMDDAGLSDSEFGGLLHAAERFLEAYQAAKTSRRAWKTYRDLTAPEPARE